MHSKGARFVRLGRRHIDDECAGSGLAAKLAFDDIGSELDGDAVWVQLAVDPSGPWEDAAVARGYQMREGSRR